MNREWWIVNPDYVCREKARSTTISTQPDEEFFEDGHNFEDEHDAGVEFDERIDSIISNITGDLSEDEIEAMIHVLLEPDTHQ
ncbi:MAG: hypothetical protein QF437_06020 [Planctomycetota bacterium]|nr:hypothetical protein [Planctomycetota bacterium]